eukprot:Anaeramoba_ignava/a90627_140.p2 GENE.a90627_140~~a90627_140.p2  ORF type:complete len:227 (+),score=64.53 a90627_140:1745-2425(+)
MEKKPICLIIFGPPAAGKGTQSAKIKEKYQIRHLSTGDMLRESIANKTKLGETAEEYMNAGKLVPDDLVKGIVEEVLNSPSCANGFLLDGYPRTMRQAQDLDEILSQIGKKLTAVINLDVPQKKLIERVVGRMIHPPSGRIYHKIFKPPKVPMKDDITGEDLIIRKDDTEEVMKSRLQNYFDQANKILEHYKKENLLIVNHFFNFCENKLSNFIKIIIFFFKINVC